jgi:hypothetical protein
MSSFPFLSLHPAIAWALSAPGRFPSLMQCKARLLWFRFVWDLAQPCYVPDTLQGVLLFWIFSCVCVRAPEAPAFCPLMEEWPPSICPSWWKSSETPCPAVSKFCAKKHVAILSKNYENLLLWQVIPARFENKWSMLWIWLKRKNSKTI